MTPLTFPPSSFTSSASPSSSSSFSQSPPTSWNSAPRPRLKRSHSSSQPAAPANSPEGPLSPSLLSSPSLLLSPHQPSFGTTSTTSSEGGGGGGGSGLGQAMRARPSLTVIDEVPQAETLATSPIVPNPLLSSSSSQPRPLHDDEDRPSKSKRRRTAPDHEAFGRLTLSHSPIPSNSTQSPSSSFPLLPPTSSSSPPSHYTLTSPVQSSFPPVPPTSPDFLPFSHHGDHHQQNLSTSPPPIVFPPSPMNSRASGIVVPHSNGNGNGNGMDAEEIEMSKAPSSWDVSPHTIYVASLSDDEDEDDIERRQKEEETFRLNSLASSQFSQPQPILPLSRRQKPADALILYQPLPSLRPTATEKEKEEGSRKMETRVERLRREEIERRKEEAFGEFRRESERVEGKMDADPIGGEGEGEEMEVEMEL